jgi:hypothetical protein
MTSQDDVSTAVSRDGTRIAFDRYGSGPVLILISGARRYGRVRIS